MRDVDKAYAEEYKRLTEENERRRREIEVAQHAHTPSRVSPAQHTHVPTFPSCLFCKALAEEAERSLQCFSTRMCARAGAQTR